MATLRYLTLFIVFFWSLHAWSLDDRFDRDWETGQRAKGEVAAQFSALLERQPRYLELLDGEKGFNGLYLRLEETRGLDRESNRLRYGLDWELFSNGRYEAAKRQRRKRLNSLVQYWQLYADMWERLLDERLFQVQALRERLERAWLSERRELLARQLKVADAELAGGFMLKEEHELYRQRLQTTDFRLQALGAGSVIAMPQVWRRILNRVEEWKLPTVEDLLAKAVVKHPGLKLQELFRERANFHPEWRDDLEARLYVQGEQTDRFGNDGWQVGVRVRLPLDRPQHREETIDLEQGNYRLQAAGLRARLRQRLAALGAQFQRHQAILKGQLYQRRQLEQETRRTRQHADRAIASLRHSPGHRLRELERERLDLAHQVLLERLQLLEYLLRIGGLTGESDPEDLEASAGD